jgi:sarcosine oxidase subunit alpha
MDALSLTVRVLNVGQSFWAGREDEGLIYACLRRGYGSRMGEAETGEYRIRKHPYFTFPRGERIAFTYDGRPLEAYRGETLAEALLASGIRTFSRSVKYHRPRGPFCNQGGCPGCLLRVNGVPNVRACRTLIEEGMDVRSQNAFPGAAFDLLGVLDRLSFLLPPAFPVRGFIHPTFLKGVYQRTVRRLAGVGTIPEAPPSAGERRIVDWEREIVVVGGGIAGLSAAWRAAEAGASVTLIDREEEVGGGLLFQGDPLFPAIGEEEVLPSEEIKDLARKAEEAEVEFLTEATTIGLYPERELAVVDRGRGLRRIRAQRIVLATGTSQELPLFINNDLPGVFAGPGLQRLLHRRGIRPGKRALLSGSGNYALSLAYQLHLAGIEVVGIVEEGEEIRGERRLRERVEGLGVPLFPSHTLQEAFGRGGVEGALLVERGSASEKRVSCDLIVPCDRFRPNFELLWQAGCRMIPIRGKGPLPYRDGEMATDREGIWVAGGVGGTDDAGMAALEGEVAGLAAALSLGHGEDGQRGLLEEMKARLPLWGRGTAERSPSSFPWRRRGKLFLCLCEDVTLGEVLEALEEGYDDIESLKRFSGVGTGFCQGKLCLRHLCETLAETRGLDPGAVSPPTQRPPIFPTEIHYLAGDGDVE